MKTTIIDRAVEFSRKYNFSFEVHEFKKKELWGKAISNEDRANNWSTFEKRAGVYFLSEGQEAIYVGKSIRDTGSRLFTHFKTPDKMKYCSPDTDIVILTFSNDIYLTAALESYLIDHFSPLKNKKR